MNNPRSLWTVDFGAEALPDLHELLARARSAGPVVKVGFFGQPAWLVSRYDDVAAAFADEESIPAAAAYSVIAEPVQGRTLQCMTGAEHRLNRALVSPAFRPAAVRGLVESLIREVAEELAGDLARSSRADLVEEFAARMPFLVIVRLLGLDGSALPELRRWANALFSLPVDPEKAMAGAADFTGFLAGLIAERRRTPREDLLSRLVTAEVDDPEGKRHRLTDEEIFSFIRLLFPAGADTTYRGIGSMLYALLAHPGWWERARDEPEVRDAVVDEALRWEPPVAVQPRRTAAPCVWGDVKVPAGEWVLFGTAGANRDPAHFADPDRFDPDRGRSTVPILTFGAGPHYCLGAHLARAEMRAALDVLAARCPGMALAVPPSEVVVGDAILRGPKALPVDLRPGGGPPR